MDEIRERIRRAAQAAGPAVVGLGRGWGAGSGVVVAEGAVLAAPVVEGRRGRARGRHGGHGPGRPAGRPPEGQSPGGRGDGPLAVTFAGGRVAEARVAGEDPVTGLPVLAVDTGGVAPVGAAAQPPGLGDPVLALADPGGRGLRVTAGRVASAPRTVPGPRGTTREAGIEHTAPLPRGAAGGPLLDADGALVGVNVLRPAPGLILAVWTGEDVAARAAAVVAGTIPAPRTLGVAVAPQHVARRLRAAVGLPEVPGVLVREVDPDGPAARAGIAPGDLLTTAGGLPVDGAGALARAIDATPPGAALEVALVRGTDVRAASVTFPSPPGP